MDALPSQPSDGRSKWNGLCGSLVLIQLEGLSGLKIIELLYLNVYNRLLNSCGIKLESPTNDFACPSLQFTMSSFGAWRQTRAGGERERRRKRQNLNHRQLLGLATPVVVFLMCIFYLQRTGLYQIL
ncbi:hypothetical protein D1007_56421 [Hordeum vulgare]|nr:hypothetical protein D1007_56421 [Hordeum vulgare]